MEPSVPETRGARALVWAALAAAALGFAVTPRAPAHVRLVGDTEKCRLESDGGSAVPCDCARIPLELRETLGVPAPLNSLSARQLERVPELGSVRAAAVANERDRHGAYESLDQVAARVPGIGPKTIDRIRSRLYVSGPDPACIGSRE